MADNSYGIEFKIASKNGWDTPTEAKARYGRYSRDGLTVHWWNTPELAGTHDGTVAYILRQAAAGNMSVNYVVSDSKITLVVGPDNVAWHATKGNPTTVGVEFDPRLGAEGYKKAGWLLDQLEQRWGKTLKLYKHSDWSSTACPGTLDLAKIRAEATKWKNGIHDAKPAPVVTPPPVVVPPVVVPPVVVPSAGVPSELDKQNNELLKQILSLLQGLVAKFNSIFK